MLRTRAVSFLGVEETTRALSSHRAGHIGTDGTPRSRWGSENLSCYFLRRPGDGLSAEAQHLTLSLAPAGLPFPQQILFAA